jgi:hypothetical protein
MKELFPAGVLPNLQNLEVIEVVNVGLLPLHVQQMVGTNH